MKTRAVFSSTLLAAILLLASGCGGGGGGGGGSQAGPEQFHGTWIEVRTAGGTGRLAPAKPKSSNLRELTINSDGTYKLEVVTPEGRPLSKPETVTGRWQFRDRTLSFSVESDTLAERHKGWHPTEIANQTRTDDGSVVISVFHGDEEAATYKRKN